MRITRVHVRTFKSLWDLELLPADLTVLVGPNNAGKTNIAEVLDFLADVHRFGLDLAVQRKGGYENIAHRRVRRSKNPITVGLTAVVSGSEVARPRRLRGNAALAESFEIEYHFSLRSTTQGVEAAYRVDEESITVTRLISRGHGERILSVDRKAGSPLKVFPKPDKTAELNQPHGIAYPFQDQIYHNFLLKEADGPGILLPALGFNQIIKTYVSALERIRVYQLSPVELRRPGVPGAIADLERYGANLPTMIARMKRDDPRAWQRVMGTMRRIVPTLEDVEVAPTHDRRLALSFREEGVGRAWTSEEVSDGTVQCLALFAALNEKGIPLLVFEEPENSLHPAVLRAFVDACRALVDVQVILTTHSPVLLSYVEPSEVTVVWRMDGRTHAEGLERLYPHARETWTTGKGTVYDMLDSGLVRESLPPSA